MNHAINSPFRYAGGKFYARKLILEHIPDHVSYVEPFAGGASVFFAKRKAEKNWLNDIDKELINCLTVIRDYPSDLTKSIEGEQATKERHNFYKNIYKPKNNLERALRWFYLNRTSYSGIMNMQNCFWGYGDKFSMRPENWPKNIIRTSERLQGVRLTNWDFERVFSEAEDKSFFFVDPPYFNADQDKFYVHSFNKEDHYRLAKLLEGNSQKFKFLITYDDSEEIRKLYYWVDQILEKKWNYTINRTDDQTKDRRNGGNGIKRNRYKGREIFILNYDSIRQTSLFESSSAHSISY